MGMGADDVTVVIGGSSMSLQQAINQAVQAIAGLQKSTDDASAKAGGMESAFQKVTGTLGNFLTQSLSVIAGLAGFDILSQITSQVHSFAEEMFNLNNTMERMQTSWKYLFGSGNNAGSAQMAQNLADWTKKFSIDLPFTRQDLLGSINALGANESDPAVIQKYMKDIADIAATRTDFAGNPVTLSKAAYALVSGSEGMTRMLKYDLKINPAELKQFGWDEHSGSMENLLQALQQYNKKHHLTGAAHDIAHSTFSGEYSSFIDRIQNFQLLSGESPFKSLKKDLEDLNSWIDAHAADIAKWGNLIGDTVATAIRNFTKATEEFATGWQTGGGKSLFEALGALAGKGFGDLLNFINGLTEGFAKHTDLTGWTGFLGDVASILGDKNVQQGLKDLGTLLGTVIGTGFTDLGKAFKDIGDGAKDFMKNDPTQSLYMLSQTAKDLSTNFAKLKNELKQLLGKDGFAGLKTILQGLGAVIVDVVLIPIEGVLAAFDVLVQTARGAIWGIQQYFAALSGQMQQLEANLPNVQNTLQRFGNWVRGLPAQMFHGWTPEKFWKNIWGGLSTDISGAFGGLIQQATTWGGDFMQNLSNGMLAKLNDLKNTINTIAHVIADPLHHSVPTTGPLADEMDWMPHMMQNLATTMDANIRLVAAASTRTAAAMRAGIMGGQASSLAFGGYAPGTQVTVGDMTHTTNLYGANEAAMRRVAQDETVAFSRRIRPAIATPGGYGVKIGF